MQMSWQSGSCTEYLNVGALRSVDNHFIFKVLFFDNRKLHGNISAGLGKMKVCETKCASINGIY